MTISNIPDHPADVIDWANDFINTLEGMQTTFNKHSKTLGARICVKKLIDKIRDGDDGPVAAYKRCMLHGTDGLVRPNQIDSAALTMAKFIETEGKSSIALLGKTQIGKSGTTYFMQFLGPIFYHLFDIKLLVLIFVMNDSTLRAQGTDGHFNFTQMYEEIEVFPLGSSKGTESKEFEGNPSLRKYIRTFISPSLALNNLLNPFYDCIVPRTHAKRHLAGLDELIRVCAAPLPMPRSIPKPITILPIYDEAHHGAGSGQNSNKKSVMCQYTDKLQSASIFVSATLCGFDLEAIKKVTMIEGTGYVGNNWYGGKAINLTPGYTAEQATKVSFLNIEGTYDIPNFQFVDMNLYEKLYYEKGVKNHRRFVKFAQDFGYHCDTYNDIEGSIETYCEMVEDAMRAFINKLALTRGKFGGGTGLVFRFFNNNDHTDDFLERMDFENLDILRFYGEYNEDRVSVNDFVRKHRTDFEKSFMIVVSSKGRCGEAFPIESEYFFEGCSQFSTLTSAMQGFLGRCSGYNKKPTFFATGKNIRILKDFDEKRGNSTLIPANVHTVSVRGTAANNIVLRHDLDPAIDAFLNDLREYVDPLVTFKKTEGKDGKEGSVVLSASRVRNTGDNNGRMPFFQLAKKHNLFEVIEEKCYLFNMMELRLPRVNEAISGGGGVFYRYDKNTFNDDIYCGFRQDDATHFGKRRRPHPTIDGKYEYYIEPLINMNQQRELMGVTLAIQTAIPIVQNLPARNHAAERYMNSDERDARGY
jgi:hypothetical protein